MPKGFKHCTFLGGEMAQTKEELLAWEDLLGPIDFSRLIEIGSWYGNLSVYLFLFCINKNAEFYTYDILNYQQTRVKKLLGFDERFFKKDVFENANEIKDLIKEPGQSIIFCDGGDKKKEFRIFGRACKKGDIIGFHDWGFELYPRDMDFSGFKLYYRLSRLRFYIKE